MAEPQERYVNVIPKSRGKVKKEILPDDDDDMVQCRLCWKVFASEMALRNHARMEHIDAFVSGDPSVWTLTKEKSDSDIDESLVQQKRDKMLSEMEPTSVIALASNDVSYIIVKAEEGVIKTEDGNDIKRRKRDKVDKKDKEEKIAQKKEKEEKEKSAPKKERDTAPITGPFECLQPSNLVADGTCHQIFFSCCEYSIHHRDEHTRRRKGLRCQVCEKPLACTGEETPAPFACEVCGQGYQTTKELSDHKAITHVKLKPFECMVCHKRFTQQGGVLQHMRMHTGDRPFPCTFCPKSFTQKSGLDQHLRIHTKIKPYRCVVCSKTFCQSVHLKQHMRTHTNVAPFQCGICDKRFKQSSHLNYHLKNHNPAVMTEEQRAKYSELIGMISGQVLEDGTVKMETSEIGTEWCEIVAQSVEN